MTERGHRRRFPSVVTVALVLVVPVVGCSAGDDGEPATATASPTTDTPTTTVDPLAGSVLDACGNDLSDLTSTVWAVDPADGSVRWSTEVPLAETFLVPDGSGDPRLSLVMRPVELVVDVGTGDVVDHPPAGAHEVLVDPAGDPRSGVAGLTVDGEPQPVIIEVGGRRITTAAGETGQVTIGLTATDAVTAAPVWRVELGAAGEVAGVSSPVAFGDLVVVVTSSPRPDCARE